MQVAFPDILKKNRDAWTFSEEDPWKPVANEGASDEVKKAISDFIAEMNGESEVEYHPVAKTFDNILAGQGEIGADEEIDRVVSTWTDTDGIYAEEVEKGNPYHDPTNGRFTTGPASGNPMIRKGPPPKKTKIAYKVFVAKNGKLYPPMVANPDGQDTPVGVWLDASEGKMATDKDGNPITNTLGRNKVKAGGKGTQGGSGTLAYRPGWHLGEVPEAKQFYTKDKATGEKLQKKNFVWAECEIAADFDYQDEAMSYGYTKNGKFQHSLAGLPKIPTDGYYTYRTNPDPSTKPWYITGAMKVNRILTDAETNKILRSHGIEPMKRDGGELDLAALGFTETNFVGKSASDENTFNIFKTDEDKRLVFGWASIIITEDGQQLEDLQQDMIDPEDLEEAAYEYVLNFRDTGEEHIPTMRKRGKLVESCVLTAEKQKAMGIPEGTVPIGWWIGFKITDDAAWNLVKSGHYKMFSIEGKANRVPVEKSDSVAKSFDDILKYNDNHDELGRFAPKSGGSSVGLKPIKPNPKWAYQPDEETDISDMVENPIPFVGVGADMDLAVKFEDETIQSKYISDTAVSISELQTLQPFVLRSGIENYKSWDDSDRPYVVDFEGQKYVIDGNHRIAQAKLKGEKTVNVDMSVREMRVSKNLAKSFDEILKYNDNHDELGRFAPKGGGVATTSAGGKVTPEQEAKIIQFLSDGDIDAALSLKSELGLTLKEYREIKTRAKETGKLPESVKAKPTEDTPKETAKEPSKTPSDDYRMQHRPTQGGSGYDVTDKEALPDDFYDHPEWYADMRQKSYQESFNAIRSMRGNPEAEVTIYRASPKNEFNEGDWISLSPTYAKDHAARNSSETNKLTVHSKKVKAKDIQYAGDDINEFGYFPVQEALTKGETPLSRYDHIEHVRVAKTFDEIIEIEKFNPYHDARGRFSSANGATSFTYAPGKSKAHDLAIARQQNRHATAATATDTKDAMGEISAGKHNSLENYLDENGKLTPEREAVHQEIINNLLRDKIPVDGQATMTMLGGGPASGKSSVLNPDTSGDPHSVTVDPDMMKSLLPGYKEMAAKSSDASSFYHEESSALAKRFAETAIKRNLNVIYDGTGDGSEGSVQKKIDGARAGNYKVVAKYVTVDTKTAVERNQKRYDDAVAEGKTPRLVPADYVRKTHAKVTDISVSKAAEFDEIEIWDNNGAKGQQKLIAKGGSGKGLTAVDRTAFQNYLDKGFGFYNIGNNGEVESGYLPF